MPKIKTFEAGYSWEGSVEIITEKEAKLEYLKNKKDHIGGEYPDFSYLYSCGICDKLNFPQLYTDGSEGEYGGISICKKCCLDLFETYGKETD